MESWQRHLIAAEGYLELGMFHEAELAISELLPVDQQRPEALQIRCASYLRKADWAKAAALASLLTQSHPADAQNWIHLAYATRRSESIEQAEAILLQALKHHSREWCVFYNLACYAAVQGRLEEAREKLNQAMELEPACDQMAHGDPDLISLFYGS